MAPSHDRACLNSPDPTKKALAMNASTDLTPTPPPIPTPKRRKWAVAAGSVIVGVGVAVALFDWNMLRGPIGSFVSTKLERDFRIVGDLRVKPWSWQPSISAQGLEVANTPWGKAPLLSSVAQLNLKVDLRSLLRGEVLIPELVIDAPKLSLEEDAKGKPNWLLGKQNNDGGPKVKIGSLRINNGELAAELPSRKTSVQGKIATEGEGGKLAFSASGRYQGESFSLTGHSGSPLALENNEQAFPLQAKGEAGATRFAVDGQVHNLLKLAGLDVKFSVAGRSLGDLYKLTGVPLPATPPYRLAARLQQSGKTWAFSDMDGRVGGSDLHGTFVVDRGPKPQRLSGKLQSRKLDLNDLSGFIGARAANGQKVQPRPGKVLPASPLGFEKIAAANVDLDFKIDDFRNTGLPLDSTQGHLRIQDRLVTLAPLAVGVAKGKVEGKVELDARQAPAISRFDLQASQLRLKELMPTADSRALTTGTVGGKSKLVMRGNSVAELLGSADGDVGLAMSGGSTDLLLMRLANLDVANALIAWLSNGKKVPIRCAVGDFQAKDGTLTPRVLVFDTDKTLVTGKGSINMKDEVLDLHLRAESKDASLLALRGPLQLTGTFAKPSVMPEPIPLGARVASAVALGLVSPVLALVPLVELGGAKDSACTELLAQSAPRTGKKR